MLSAVVLSFLNLINEKGGCCLVILTIVLPVSSAAGLHPFSKLAQSSKNDLTLICFSTLQIEGAFNHNIRNKLNRLLSGTT